MINRYLLWGLLGAVVVGLTHTATSLGLKDDEWPAWVGAVGTVATLIGTIWLATDSERRRRREKIDLALIYAAGFPTQIMSAKIVIWEAMSHMLAHSADGPGSGYIEAAKKLRTAITWNEESLKNLVIVPGNAAVMLARASGRNLWIADMCEETGTAGDSVRLRDAYRSYHEQLELSLNEMSTASQLCMKFTDHHLNSTR